MPYTAPPVFTGKRMLGQCAPYSWPLPYTTCVEPHHPKVETTDLWECTDRILASESVASTVCRGVAVAVNALMPSADAPAPTWIPRLLDEREWPLCDPHSPLTSFPWVVQSTPGLLDTHSVRQYVCILADRFRMSACDLAMAVVLLEAAEHRNPQVVQPYTLRPLLYAASVVARKLTCDNCIPTVEFYNATADLFTNVTPFAAARIEEQLLVLLDWNVPMDSKVYDVYTTALYDAGLWPGQPNERATLLSDGVCNTEIV